MRVVAMSDTHQWHDFPVPDGDLLIHAGDMGLEGNSIELERFSNWWNKLPHEHKVFVPGNHDWIFQRAESNARIFLPTTHVLIDQPVEIEGKKIWGSPYTPWFYDWAFNVPRGMLHEHWDLIPNGLDVLITHGPPFGILDQARPRISSNVGDKELLEAVLEKKPKHHVFGHIHGSYGNMRRDDTHFYNLSVVNEAYQQVHKPTIFEI